MAVHKYRRLDPPGASRGLGVFPALWVRFPSGLLIPLFFLGGVIAGMVLIGLGMDPRPEWWV